MVKKQIRVLGIDDAHFDKFKDKETLIIGAFFRGGEFIDGIVSTRVMVDGSDSTKKITEMVKNSKFYPQIRAIMLDGIAVGGLNIVDIQRLNKATKIPVIVVMRKYPHISEMENALAKISQKTKVSLLRKAGSIHKAGSIFIQVSGTDLENAKQIIRITCTHSLIPEPIRAAHLIAGGIIFGESRGKA